MSRAGGAKSAGKSPQRISAATTTALPVSFVVSARVKHMHLMALDVQTSL